MIEAIFMWLGRTSVGTALQQSTAGFAATEALHILALSVVGGSILVANLTVLGRVLKTTAPETVFRQLQPFYRGALVLVAISGMMLVAAGPYKYYTNPLFPLKLGLLVVAVTLHAILSRRLNTQSVARRLAIASLVVWTSVVITGRWLGLI